MEQRETYTTGTESVFNERELAEIKLCLFYEGTCAHGTAGHNRMMLIAKMAHLMGYKLDGTDLRHLPTERRIAADEAVEADEWVSDDELTEAFREAGIE